jgi:hypothetical protein
VPGQQHTVKVVQDRARDVWRALRARQQLIDRYVLEEVVFPPLQADPDVREVLFVGTAPYTRSYPARFRPAHLRTIDIDIDMAPYGSDDHIIGSVTDIAEFVKPATLDAAILNGVFGFGLDDPDLAELALERLAECMKPGAWLVIGWNDHPDYRPFRPEDLRNLSWFEPTTLAPFLMYRYPTFSPLRHVFDFYRRRDVNPQAASN